MVWGSAQRRQRLLHATRARAKTEPAEQAESIAHLSTNAACFPNASDVLLRADLDCNRGSTQAAHGKRCEK